MKKYQFVSDTKWDNPDAHYYYTKEDDRYVSNSGSYDKDKAYTIFSHLCGGGSLEPIIEVLEEIIIKPNI